MDVAVEKDLAMKTAGLTQAGGQHSSCDRQLSQPVYKRQLINTLASTVVFDHPTETSQPSVCPPTPTPVSPAEVFARKEDFVESLVDTAVKMLESQWKTSTQPTKSRLVPLKTFIEEILKRSRTSFSTLQLCLLYLVRFKRAIPAYNRSLASSPASTPQQKRAHPTCCCRRMFLSALIVAAKYVQDRNYSNKAWSKISGLTVEEITANEREFLAVLDWKLFVPYKSFVNWSSMLLNLACQMRGKATGIHADGLRDNSLPPMEDGRKVFGLGGPLSTDNTIDGAPLTPPTEAGEVGIVKMYPGMVEVEGFYPSPEVEGVEVRVGRKRKLEEVGDVESGRA